MSSHFYPIGTPGQPWGPQEIAAWRGAQAPRRSYRKDVLEAVDGLRERFDVLTYGRLDYDVEAYDLVALRSPNWHPQRPCVLVTGGVHGYETSGVHGALRFAERHAAPYLERVNLLVAPCVSPWGYERINRWNPNAIDPNRSFRADSPAGESAALWQLVKSIAGGYLMHIDLHETTDSDESEFRPALAARDGKSYEPGEIPDGFYLVDDTDNPQPAFQQAIIDAVEKITHIAEADAHGRLIETPIVARGVIRYPVSRIGLCAGMTGARYTTTTEVYPDSPRATPEQCIAAQVAAVCAGLDHALAS